MRNKDSLPKLHRPSTRRRFLAETTALGVVATTWGLFPAYSGRAVADEPQRGGLMRVASTMATTIDPLKVDSGGGIAIIQQVGEYLVWAEPDMSLRPVLATRWQSDDDGRTWIFELRRGVKFHDGREMTADDVVATFDRLVDPDQVTAAKTQLPFLQKGKTVKVDDYTVMFSLDRPVGAFPYYTHIYNAIILPRDYTGNFAENPIGTGPFKLVRYRPQESAVFERNPDYWDEGKPYLDGVEIGLYESSQAMILALQGGRVDMLLLVSYIEAQPLLADPQVQLLSTPSAEHRQLCMRTDHKPFQDKRVRQAVALCFDRPAMVQGLLGGKAELGNDHPIAPIYPEQVTIEQRQKNIEQAKTLLTEAGFPNGFDTELHTFQRSDMSQYAVLAQQMLAPANIRVQLKIEPLNVYYSHWTEVDFGLTDWVTRPTAAQILSVAFTSKAEWNAAHWKNVKFDALVEQLEGEPDLEHRSQIATRIASIMNDEVPAVIAYFNHSLRPVRQNVQGVSASPANYLDLTQASLS